VPDALYRFDDVGIGPAKRLGGMPSVEQIDRTSYQISMAWVV
jgi:hypothetical protein